MRPGRGAPWPPWRKPARPTARVTAPPAGGRSPTSGVRPGGSQTARSKVLERAQRLHRQAGLMVLILLVLTCHPDLASALACKRTCYAAISSRIDLDTRVKPTCDGCCSAAWNAVRRLMVHRRHSHHIHRHSRHIPRWGSQRCNGSHRERNYPRKSRAGGAMAGNTGGSR
jgi:hypothetical protein